MASKKIAFFTEVEEKIIAEYQQALPELEVQGIPEPLHRADSSQLRDVALLSVMVHSPVGRLELDMMPSLEVIASRSTGVDHIDLVACRGAGISVCNVPDYGSGTVAEFTFTLLLAVARNLAKAHRRTIAGNRSIEGLQGMDMRGKTLGVVGFGKIGRQVAKIAQGFGMEVIMSDPFLTKEGSSMTNGRECSLAELVTAADAIAICCPLNAETHHLFNARILGLVKPGAILVNTARGGIVDSAALLAALNDGQISGAGLDVMEDEDSLTEDALLPSAVTRSPAEIISHGINIELLNHPNVIATPHIAFFTKEAMVRIQSTTVENLKAFLAGRILNSVKN